MLRYCIYSAGFRNISQVFNVVAVMSVATVAVDAWQERPFLLPISTDSPTFRLSS